MSAKPALPSPSNQLKPPLASSVAGYVYVDFELRGCPINKYQLLEVLNAFLNGRKPNVPSYSVCVECKRRQTVCVLQILLLVFCLLPPVSPPLSQSAAALGLLLLVWSFTLDVIWLARRARHNAEEAKS